MTSLFCLVIKILETDKIVFDKAADSVDSQNMIVSVTNINITSVICI